MFAQEIKQVERKYETALNEFKNFQVQKAEFEQKGREKKAETLTEIKDTSNMNTVSNVNTSVRPSTIAKPLAREPPSQDPSGDSDFDRAEDWEDILDSHINRVDRDQIQDLFKKVNEFESKHPEEEKDYSDDDEFEKESVEKSIEKSIEGSVEPSTPDYKYPKVKPVSKSDIILQAKKILNYCTERDIDIMEVQNIIFDDFSLTSKVTVANLTKLIIKKFDPLFEHDEALLLSRFMIEQPEMFTSEDNDDGVEYKFDPDKQLSHAKVVSKLQSVMSSLSAE